MAKCLLSLRAYTVNTIDVLQGYRLCVEPEDVQEVELATRTPTVKCRRDAFPSELQR